MRNNDWNEKAKDYASLATDKVKDAYEYEINFPSILDLTKDLSPKSVLDAGAGTADFTKILKTRFNNVSASDGSIEMMEQAKIINPDTDIFLWDMEKEFPLDRKYDLVISKLVIVFIENLESLAKEFSRILNRNGALVISVHHPIYWYQKYLQAKSERNKNSEFLSMDGYFKEAVISKSIGGHESAIFEFIHRTLSKYINTFTQAGFACEKIDEPQITEEFAEKHPDFKNKINVPLRLNIRFKKLK